jgi:hypothetical protein
VAEVDNAQMNIEWLDIPVVEKSRYRLKTLPDNTMGFQSQGFTFADKNKISTASGSLTFLTICPK